MRIHAFLLTALLASAPLCTAADLPAEIRKDVQLRAMSDELARAKTLRLNDLDKPYFIQYSIGDSEQVHIGASLGGILSSVRNHVRAPKVEVRVGDYKFDNTNSVYSGSPRFGMLPVDDNYQVLRENFWLLTDGFYKASADQISRKRNALREIADPEKTPDLAPAPAIQILQTPPKLNLDSSRWEEILRRASAILAQYPDVMESNIQLRSIVSTYRLVNSEGTVIRIPQELSDISIRTSALAGDGSRVWNFTALAVLEPSQLISSERLNEIVQTQAAETVSLSKAPLAADYSGPVLFEQQAAAQMMASVLTDAVRLQRKPVAPPGGANNGQSLESVWSARLGLKVSPEWLTLVDDPSQQQFNGAPLAGSYQIDDEGVQASRVLLVDKGVLKAFLTSREPVKDLNASNGHGRLPGAFGAEEAVIGNMFIQAAETTPEHKMKSELLARVKASGQKYGLLIRKLDFPSTTTLDELQSLMRQAQKGGYARTLNAPLLAYRVYPDGHEELVRGLRFKDFSAKNLRDIALASDRPYVLNYVNNGSGFNHSEATAEATTSTLISPSLLFDSVDLARAEDEPGKLPLVAPPALVAQP